MDEQRRTISVAPDSEIGLLVRDAARAEAPIDIYTGEATYRVEVTPISVRHGGLGLRELANRLAGSLANVDIPGWESSEAAERWVEALRQSDTESPERPGRP
jgi:hypothetical protein